MHSRCIVLTLACLLIAGVLLAAQTSPPPPKPISQQGLTEALRIGGLTPQELIDIVKDRGVAFQVTEQVETDLRAAGAPASLIEAVRANYRPPAVEKPAQLVPLSKNEILTLLEVGTPSARIEQIVSQRGVSFPLTPAITRELTSAGAQLALLTAIEAAWAKSSAATAASPAQPAAPLPQTVSPTQAAAPVGAPAQQPVTTPPAPAVKRLSSLKEVRELYVDKIKNNLDQYLRAELTKQLPGRFLLVTNKEEADALLVGTGEQQTSSTAALTGRLGLNDTARGAVSIVDKGGTVLWASEAGDRTLLFGPLKRGGPAEVAKRLVQDLKKALDEAD